MKHDIHPAYGPVAFRDRSTGRTLLTRSTLVVDDHHSTAEIDGGTYPIVGVDVTSDSHPFWTGTKRAMDTEGRLEKFNRRYGRA